MQGKLQIIKKIFWRARIVYVLKKYAIKTALKKEETFFSESNTKASRGLNCFMAWDFAAADDNHKHSNTVKVIADFKRKAKRMFYIRGINVRIQTLSVSCDKINIKRVISLHLKLFAI